MPFTARVCDNPKQWVRLGSRAPLPGPGHPRRQLLTALAVLAGPHWEELSVGTHQLQTEANPTEPNQTETCLTEDFLY